MTVNLGSLAGRILFEPVETQSRMQFGRLAAAAADYNTARALLRCPSGCDKPTTVNCGTADNRKLMMRKFSFLASLENGGAFRIRPMAVGAIGALFACFPTTVLATDIWPKWSTTDAWR